MWPVIGLSAVFSQIPLDFIHRSVGTGIGLRGHDCGTVTDDAGQSHGAERPPEPPRFEAKGRPPHDFFADGKAIRLRLSPDYTPPAFVPVWHSSPYTDALVPPKLIDELIAWHEEFNENFDPDRGWRSKEVMDRWAAEGNKLAAELRSALVGKAELEVDLWPLPRGEPSWKTKGW